MRSICLRRSAIWLLARGDDAFLRLDHALAGLLGRRLRLRLLFRLRGNGDEPLLLLDLDGTAALDLQPFGFLIPHDLFRFDRQRELDARLLDDFVGA